MDDGESLLDGEERMGGPGDKEDSLDRVSRNDIHVEDIWYSARSCVVVIKPVVLAMVLTSLAVFYIQDEDLPAGQAGQMYLVYAEPADGSGGGDSTSTLLGRSLLNSLAIIGYVIAMTFMLVLFMYLKCFKCLSGYMFLSGIMVLGMLTFSMFFTAIKSGHATVSTWMFYLLLYNYTVVGMVAIFYQKGVPPFVGQGYKVACSVMMAWQFYRIFPTWTSWALLFMLVLYDLCAVLTPCGPLNCFVKIMMRDEGEGGGFAMPLLLYEASVPDAERGYGDGGDGERPVTVADRAAAAGATGATAGQANRSPPAPRGGAGAVRPVRAEDAAPLPVHSGAAATAPAPAAAVLPAAVGGLSTAAEAAFGAEELHSEQDAPDPALADVAAPVPVDSSRPNPLRLRLVDFYARYNPEKVDSVDEIMQLWQGRERDLLLSLDRKYGTNWTGRHPGGAREHDDDDDDDDDHSLKLGLGDFIFYSLLVSHASAPENGSYQFMALSICMLVIVLGLVSTLMLLPVLPVDALPALPISITLGIIFYLLTNFLVDPYVSFVTPVGVMV